MTDGNKATRPHNVTFRVNPEMLAFLEGEAKEQGRSRSQIIVRIIETKMQNKE